MYNIAMNTLQLALKRRSMTMTEASKKGIPLSTITKHCNGMRELGLKAVLRYETLLGIPRSELRPDLWPPQVDAKESPNDN